MFMVQACDFWEHRDFQLDFRGEATPHIPVGSDAAHVKMVLENLPTVGHVDVEKLEGTDTAARWSVTFRTEAGDLPPMGITAGRLTGGTARADVNTFQPGTAATLIYDGVNKPGVRRLMARELTASSTPRVIAN